MPSLNDLKNSKYLTQHDVDPKVVVTFQAFKEDNVAMENEPARMKWIFKFREFDKPLVMNWTNGEIITDLFGTDKFEQWIGKQVILYRDKNVSFGGKRVGGIRVCGLDAGSGQQRGQQQGWTAGSNTPSSQFEPPPEFDPTPQREPGQDEDPFDTAMKA